jgi:hypothetical protein
MSPRAPRKGWTMMKREAYTATLFASHPAKDAKSTAR